MKLILATEVVRASVQFQGEVNTPGTVKLKPGKGSSGGPPPMKVSVPDMIEQIRLKFAITEDEALQVKEVTEEKRRIWSSLRPCRLTNWTCSSLKAPIRAR